MSEGLAGSGLRAWVSDSSLQGLTVSSDLFMIIRQTSSGSPCTTSGSAQDPLASRYSSSCRIAKSSCVY